MTEEQGNSALEQSIANFQEVLNSVDRYAADLLRKANKSIAM